MPAGVLATGVPGSGADDGPAAPGDPAARRRTGPAAAGRHLEDAAHGADGRAVRARCNHGPVPQAGHVPDDRAPRAPESLAGEESAVGKAAALLRAFDPTVEVLSIRGLAARTGMPRSTVHVLARRCARPAAGDGPGTPAGGSGPLLLELGGLIIERTGLVAAVEGSTAALRRAPGQELHVGQLVEGWIVYLHRESAPNRVDDGEPGGHAGARVPGRVREERPRRARAGGRGRADPRLCRDEDVPRRT